MSVSAPTRFIISGRTRTIPRGWCAVPPLASYQTDDPAWETVLDVDALAAEEGREWVYKGSTCLPPALTKCMIALSDGGEDATVLREFDMQRGEFVRDGFVLEQKSQGGVSWVDEDTLLVGRDFGEGTLTESEYPFTTPRMEARHRYRRRARDLSRRA